MRILILGGTVFLGRHVANEALARGHDVTIYTRGLPRHAHPTTPSTSIGDRADLIAAHGRTWDAAIDTSGYDPDARRERPRRSTSATTSSSRAATPIPTGPTSPSTRTRPCGRTARATGRTRPPPSAQLPAGPLATVRAGLIVGPHDNVFRLPWWVRRITEGGRVPAPGDPDRPLQVIDARDLATFLLDLAEQRHAGAFNGTGPIGQTTMRELLEAAGDAELRWIPDEKLEAAEVEPWIELPLWLPERYRGHLARRHRDARRPPACAAARSRRPSPTSAPGSSTAARRSSTTGAPSTGRRRCLRAGGCATPTPVLGIRVA